jgi:MFS family permease
LTLGLNAGWSSPVQYQLSYNRTNETAELVVLDKKEWSWAASLLILGALAGALCAGSVVDRFGRKKGLQLSSIPFVLGWILIIAAQNPSK